MDMIGSQRESMEKKDKWYGDQKNDQEMIINGFKIYDILD